MIISHKHKYIFIKTKKTAGTSIEIALSKYCGKDDIITRITKKDEEIRKELGYPGPQNRRIPMKYYTRNEWLKLFLEGRATTFRNHYSSEQISQFIDPEIWNTYYKFCFERNPFDKVVSFYYHSHPKDPRPTLTEFIHSDRNLIDGTRGFDLYTKGGNIIVDRVCRYENLEEEMKFLAEKLNLPEVPTLPHAKGSFRKEKKHYRDLLNDQDKEKLTKVFSREMAYFGYEF